MTIRHVSFRVCSVWRPKLYRTGQTASLEAAWGGEENLGLHLVE